MTTKTELISSRYISWMNLHLLSRAPLRNHLIYLSQKTNSTFLGLPYTHKMIFTCWKTRFKSKICQMFKEHKYEGLLLKGNSYPKSTLTLNSAFTLLWAQFFSGWLYIMMSTEAKLGWGNKLWAWIYPKGFGQCSFGEIWLSQRQAISEKLVYIGTLILNAAPCNFFSFYLISLQ